VKGIGSDMLNEADMANDPQERARRAQLSSQFSSSTAIGSDAYFGRYNNAVTIIIIIFNCS
jgi:hypothetical protein